MVCIESSPKAFAFLREYLTADVEEVWAVALNPGKLVLAVECIFRGTVDACLVHPRDIFRFGCLNNASSLIVAHNHPSQEMLPSQEDITFTERLIAGGYLMEIPILDHLILIKDEYLSMADQKLCQFRPNSFSQWLSSRSRV